MVRADFLGEQWSITKIENLPDDKNEAMRRWFPDSGGHWSSANAVMCVGSWSMASPQERDRAV